MQARSQSLIQFSGNLPTFIAVLLAWINTNGRISDLNHRHDELKGVLRAAIQEIKNEILRESANTREQLRSEFRRVEEVMDARLKHLEEREH